MRDGVRQVVRQLMEVDIDQYLGRRAVPAYPRAQGLPTVDQDTRVAALELWGAAGARQQRLPALLQRCQRGEQGAVQEAYMRRVSTRRADDLVKALGLTAISMSHVSRLCPALGPRSTASRAPC